MQSRSIARQAGPLIRFIETEIFYDSLDEGIRGAVKVLATANVETFESCQGGDGHAYPEPTVRFFGNRAEGFRALAAAMQAGLKVAYLRRTWPINEDEPTGPWWEIVLVPNTVR